MWELLTQPIDPSRPHDLSFAVAWHGRLMVLGWGILAPVAIIIARFFKILPGQNWPDELDSQVWWRSHWMGQSVVAGLTIGALVLVLPSPWQQMTLHSWLGYLVLTGLIIQVLLGVLRGSKGGPTDLASDGSMRGHHYDMSPRRRAFEALHKSIGYGLLILAAFNIALGLWSSNAPVWMWLTISLWWSGLILISVKLQKRGNAVDTYQAIWGSDPQHPGNRRCPPGWGVRRLTDDHDESSDNSETAVGDRA